MSEARLHALHWAFFVDVMNMKFEDVYAMFSAWCESVPADEMADIMALGDELFGDDDTDDEQPDNLYTEDEIWADVSSDISLN
jgi:hypothetical protein